MKVLLDENLPHRLRFSLASHDVSTVRYVGWSGSKNGILLDPAEGAGYEVLITGDQNLTYQQSIIGRNIAVVTLTTNEFPAIAPHLEKIEHAVPLAAPGSFQVVLCEGRHRKFISDSLRGKRNDRRRVQWNSISGLLRFDSRGYCVASTAVRGC